METNDNTLDGNRGVPIAAQAEAAIDMRVPQQPKRKLGANSLQLTIIDFIEHPETLNDQSLSAAQKTVLKCVYGMPLTDSELQLYRRGTGRESYDAKEQREVSVIAGRRGGKTSKLAATIVLFEAFRDHGLPPGEDAHVMLLAPTLAQSRIAFRYIRSYIRRSKILSEHVLSETKSEIRLSNHITIGCHASTYDRVRGRTVVAVICDELAFWPDGDAAANPATEILDAVRPAMATIRNAKLVKISTPFSKSGILWNEFQQRSELDFPVWQLSTFELNPTVTRERVEPEFRRSEEKFSREFLAQFTDAVNGWVDAEVLDPCVVRGRRDLPYQRNVKYIAAIDAATRHADFALVILHRMPDGMIVVDRVATWTGTKKVPLPFEGVLSEIKTILESYQLNVVVGDQYYADAIKQYLLELGIIYEICNFGAATRPRIFSNLKHLMVQGKIQLPDDPELLGQLRNLREEKTPRGHIDVRPTSGKKDDRSVALALAASEAILRPQEFLGPELGLLDNRPSPAELGLIPQNCRLGSICANTPRCMDENCCLGFKDQRLCQILPAAKKPRLRP